MVEEKISGKYFELASIGISSEESEIENFVIMGKEWVDREKERRQPRPDLFGEERRKCEQERLNVEQFLSNITNISIDGADLIPDRVFVMSGSTA